MASCAGGEPEVNENIQKAAEVLMNAPNDEIFSFEQIGLDQGSQDGAEDRAAKLEELLRECIAEGYYDPFFNNGPDAMLIPGNAYVLDMTVSLESIALKDKDDDGQTVTVQLKVNGETEITADVRFELDEDGLLKSMRYDENSQLPEALASAAAK